MAKAISKAPAQSAAKGLGRRAEGFTDAERAAMKERAREAKAEARASKNRADAERTVLEKIAEMPRPDRTLGERLHAIVTANAPGLWPKLWYGMPAYANPPPPVGDGKVVCFFQAASKFKTRYASFAFTDSAKLDGGGMWATGFGLGAMTGAEEGTIGELVRKAVR
ncbi:MAG: DUF1801 domain-containing protein [Planctomycetes bacterium]|nr:DUF1801 domain-containing protein [Planctomycetota bacterium]